MPKFNMSDFAKTLGAVPEQGTKQIEYMGINIIISITFPSQFTKSIA